MKQELSLSKESADREVELAGRRTTLANAYDALPAYGSVAFWCVIEEPETAMEVLVRCIRTALTLEDNRGRNRLLEIIFRRIHITNEYWANSVLKTLILGADERIALVHDLYADLCESVIRAIMDPQRLFWEENFQHCLSFERQHVYQSFMRREGHWNSQTEEKTARIPRLLLKSLDQLMQSSEYERYEPYLEDELARKALLVVEHAELPGLIFHLPDKLKPVVLLIFWEDKTEKDTASILGISDRTVRNRLHRALHILYHKLTVEREYIHG